MITEVYKADIIEYIINNILEEFQLRRIPNIIDLNDFYDEDNELVEEYGCKVAVSGKLDIGFLDNQEQILSFLNVWESIESYTFDTSHTYLLYNIAYDILAEAISKVIKIKRIVTISNFENYSKLLGGCIKWTKA